MDLALRDRFTNLWEKYFEGADLPIAFFYTDQEDQIELVQPPKTAHQCIIGVLARVFKGHALRFGADSFGCGGAKRYIGYEREMRPNFEYFLSCGIEGEMEGERYKKSPEIVRQIMKDAPWYSAPGKYVVFKRWDALGRGDEPDVVIFFAAPDILSGLYTLSGFEETANESVIAPFSAGCGSIVLHPYLEKRKERPRAVIGMFDVSARPYVPKDVFSFAIPINKFAHMVDDMEESFLITPSWARVQKRISRNGS